MAKANRVKATRTSFRVIEVLEERGGAGVTDVAEHLDISRSGAHKHLSTLADLGYVEKNGTEYQITVQFFQLGMSMRSRLEIVRMSRDDLDNLSNIIDEQVSLYTWRENWSTTVCVYTTSYRYDTVAAPNEGEEHGLTTLPAGRVILAHCAEDVFADIETDDLKRGELISSLQTIRDRHIAFEIEDSTYRIAMPILVAEKPIGVVEVDGPTDRLKGKRAEEDVPGMMISTIRTIERRLDQRKV